MTYLKARTGKDDKYWLNRIGVLIGKYSRPGKVSDGTGGIHDETDLGKWVADLSKEVESRIEKTVDMSHTDGNLAFAAVMGYLLVKWYVRIARAKSYDPRRRVKDRQKALKFMSYYCQELVGIMTDQSRDAEFFPSQLWDDPFSPKAKDGKYR